ncbi:hypothetical protein KL944_005242 [Ogataea haglerorum]|nr:hypothetical protein KL944_005242 [Ogataea haglerorum]
MSSDEIKDSQERLESQKRKFYESDAGDGTKRSEQYLHGAKLWMCVSSIMLCLFLVALDQTISFTILVQVSEKFRSFEKLTWITSAFVLGIGCTAQVWGRLSIIFGVCDEHRYRGDHDRQEADDHGAHERHVCRGVGDRPDPRRRVHELHDLEMVLLHQPVFCGRDRAAVHVQLPAQDAGGRPARENEENRLPRRRHHGGRARAHFAGHLVRRQRVQVELCGDHLSVCHWRRVGHSVLRLGLSLCAGAAAAVQHRQNVRRDRVCAAAVQCLQRVHGAFAVPGGVLPDAAQPVCVPRGAVAAPVCDPARAGLGCDRPADPGDAPRQAVRAHRVGAGVDRHWHSDPAQGRLDSGQKIRPAGAVRPRGRFDAPGSYDERPAMLPEDAWQHDPGDDVPLLWPERDDGSFFAAQRCHLHRHAEEKIQPPPAAATRCRPPAHGVELAAGPHAGRPRTEARQEGDDGLHPQHVLSVAGADADRVYHGRDDVEQAHSTKGRGGERVRHSAC